MPRFFRSLSTLLLCVALAAACVFLHEAGHVLAGHLNGGRTTRFVLVSSRPHVRLQGAFTPAQRAMQAAGGSMLLLAVCLPGAALVPRRRRWNTVAGVLTFFSAIEILAWGLAACLYPLGPRNDVWKFIRYSGVHPGQVILISFCLVAALLVIHRANIRVVFSHTRAVPRV